jgi:hypothetical protein
VRECRRFVEEHATIGPITFALFGRDALDLYEVELARST